MTVLLWRIYVKYESIISLRHVKMSPKEIVDDTREGAEPVLKMLEERKAARV